MVEQVRTNTCPVLSISTVQLAESQVEYPGTYRDALLRILQRRLKIWRSEIAHTMVFGAMHSRQPENRSRVESG